MVLHVVLFNLFVFILLLCNKPFQSFLLSVLVDAQYRPNILRYNATIKFDNFSTGETLYEYRSDRGYTNITWSNQPSFNNFDLQLDADFKYLEIFGAVPAFPNYVNNASFGIVEGRVQFTHIRSGSGKFCRLHLVIVKY